MPKTCGDDVLTIQIFDAVILISGEWKWYKAFIRRVKNWIGTSSQPEECDKFLWVSVTLSCFVVHFWFLFSSQQQYTEIKRPEQCIWNVEIICILATFLLEIKSIYPSYPIFQYICFKFKLSECEIVSIIKSCIKLRFRIQVLHDFSIGVNWKICQVDKESKVHKRKRLQTVISVFVALVLSPWYLCKCSTVNGQWHCFPFIF